MHVLLDLGATHSFVSSMFLDKLNIMLETLFEELVIYTLVDAFCWLVDRYWIARC